MEGLRQMTIETPLILKMAAIAAKLVPIDMCQRKNTTRANQVPLTESEHPQKKEEIEPHHGGRPRTAAAAGASGRWLETGKLVEITGITGNTTNSTVSVFHCDVCVLSVQIYARFDVERS